ncbi:MAG: thioredoxin family protein [Candidatus Kapaibacteriota bacterium]
MNLIKLFCITSITLLIAFTNSFAKPEVYIDENGKTMVIGISTWKEWQEETHWENAKDSLFSQSSLDSLKNLTRNSDISFLIFAGSWCGDSKSELPKIIKLFDLIELPKEKFKLFGVDRNKLEPTNTSSSLSIERVPTLVILSEGNEIGRIVEYPNISWSEDIIKFILIKK